ncbi:hypothetical protein BKA93DRAFT_821838 [Sparassis latifolia]
MKVSRETQLSRVLDEMDHSDLRRSQLLGAQGRLAPTLLPSLQNTSVERYVSGTVPANPDSQNFVEPRTWGTSAGWWGVGAGIYVLYLLSVTPLVKRDFLSKVPMVGSYYADKVPASDKPF